MHPLTKGPPPLSNTQSVVSSQLEPTAVQVHTVMTTLRSLPILVLIHARELSTLSSRWSPLLEPERKVTSLQ